MCKILDPVDDDEDCFCNPDELVSCSCGGRTPTGISATKDDQGWQAKVVKSAVKAAGRATLEVDVMMAVH